VSELRTLYDRYKLLALGVGTELLLDEDGAASLAQETLLLAADAGRHRETDDGAAAAAAHRASLDLHRLAVAAPDTAGHAQLIAQVRASHRALRAQLWDLVYDQYAPCGAHPHGHGAHRHGHSAHRHGHSAHSHGDSTHPHRHTEEPDHV
jgi:hypothetical protein